MIALLVLAAAQSAGSAHAETPRAAHVVGLFVDQPAVLVASDRAYVMNLPDGAVTVCAYATGSCRPIREASACSGAECPNGGMMLRLEGAVADVGDYPSDRDGLAREQGALANDPRVSALAGYMRQPPSPSPPPSFWLREGAWRLELGVGAGVGGRPDDGITTPSLYGSVGIGFGNDWDHEDVLHAMFGNVMGIELRVRVLPGILGTSFDQMSVMVGAGMRALWAPRNEPFRIGAGYFSILPEMGVITRPDLDPAFYFGWSYPVSVALDEHVGVEVRGWAYLVDDWIEGDDVGWVAGVDAELLVF